MLLLGVLAFQGACASDEGPSSTAEFCGVYSDDFARLAPFTPAGTEAENRERIGELVAVSDRLHAASPEPIRDHTAQLRDHAHKVKKVLDRTGYDLNRYNNIDPPQEFIDLLTDSPTDAAAAIKDFATNNCP